MSALSGVDHLQLKMVSRITVKVRAPTWWELTPASIPRGGHDNSMFLPMGPGGAWYTENSH